VKMSQSLNQSQHLEQAMTQRQYLGQALTLKLSLIQELRGVQYNPRAECPKCGRKLSDLEILEGFNNDPNDLTTRCTACFNRFTPKLIYRSDFSSVEIPFFCSVQALERLRGMENLLAEEIMRRETGLYHSVIFHHGSLKAGFKQIGIEYAFDEITGWQQKVHSFLGRLPDTVIAEHAGVTADRVGKLRRKLRIPKFVQPKFADT